MSPAEFALLGDDRLSAEARVVGLLVYMAGEDGLTYADIESFLPDTPRERMKRAVQILERTKWIIRTAGGRGHGDRFTYLESENNPSYEDFRVAICGHAINRLPSTARLKNIEVPGAGGLNALEVPCSPPLSAPSSSSTEPPPPPLDARVREWVESRETLEGCRGALLDYVSERVEPERQLAYVQTVAGYIEGADEAAWMLPTGGHHREGRAPIVAGCLNELRQGDEVGRYFTGPPGDARNLRSKIRHKVKSIAGAKHDAERRSDGRESPGTSAAARGKPKGRSQRAPIVRVVGRDRDHRDPDRDRAVS